MFHYYHNPFFQSLRKEFPYKADLFGIKKAFHQVKAKFFFT